ncbi:MAG: heavy-metal-associated domain-containing protein [Firmicutes bacterium]|nr:heavy-metal-associated domain-containing protein [Bacillota bacterium]
MTKEILIEGMSCEHCVRHVEAALGQMAGVRAVRVELARKRAIVEIEATVPDEQLKKAIEELGYDVKAIRNV